MFILNEFYTNNQAPSDTTIIYNIIIELLLSRLFVFSLLSRLLRFYTFIREGIYAFKERKRYFFIYWDENINFSSWYLSTKKFRMFLSESFVCHRILTQCQWKPILIFHNSYMLMNVFRSYWKFNQYLTSLNCIILWHHYNYINFIRHKLLSKNPLKQLTFQWFNAD